MILLKNGRVIDPASSADRKADVLIIGDRVTLIDDNITEALAESISGSDKLEIIDCKGCIVGPGLVDIHVHFRDPGFEYKEDIYTGAKAAAAGGFTSVVLMANTKPAVDNVETLKYVIDKGAQTDINVYTCANITEGLQGKKLTDFEQLKAAGAVGFTDDGIPLVDFNMVKNAMKEAVRNNVVLSFHEEDPYYISNNGVNRGAASDFYAIGGSDSMAEISLVERDLEYALETGAKINIQHISTSEALVKIRDAKKRQDSARGQHIFAEATPHHIALTEEATIEKGTLAKMNPPLRREVDRLAIIGAIKDDTIDFIATDHAPHSEEEKAKPITEAPSGIIGLETALPIVYEELVKKENISWVKIFAKMSLNPAKLYELPAGKLQENALADIVIFDENLSKEYNETFSKSKNSPFFGRRFDGNIAYTICKGKVIYRAK